MTLTLIGGLLGQHASGANTFDVRQFTPAELATHPPQELVSCVPRIARACDDPLARRFVPKSFIDEGGNTAGDRRERIDCAVSHVDLARKGEAEFTAVAYANGDEGAFLVIKGKGTAATELFSMSRAGMLGDLTPELETSDLDGDGTPEMIAYYTGRQGVYNVWVFRYHDGQVRSIAPLDPGDEETSLLEGTVFVDFDGDGKKDAVNRVGTAPAPAADSETDGPVRAFEYRVYTMVDGGFRPNPTQVAFFGLFSCAKGKPERVEERFTFNGPEHARTLRVVNGGSGVAASSATIRLNGAPVVSPDDFRTKKSHFDVPVNLRDGENKFAVEVAGKCGSDVAVFIY